MDLESPSWDPPSSGPTEEDEDTDDHTDNDHTDDDPTDDDHTDNQDDDNDSLFPSAVIGERPHYPVHDSSDADMPVILQLSAREEDDGVGQAPRSRVATVYDAVAGRVWTSTTRTSFRTHDSEFPLRARSSSIPGSVSSSGSGSSSPRDHRRHCSVESNEQEHSARRRPLAPEEILSRRGDAAAAATATPRDGERELPGWDPAAAALLPDSDLLGAVHVYASRFYGAMTRRGVRRQRQAAPGLKIDQRSMDETALLAFGILLEEAAREALASQDDLVFTEGIGDDRCGTEGNDDDSSGVDMKGGDEYDEDTPVKMGEDEEDEKDEDEEVEDEEEEEEEEEEDDEEEEDEEDEEWGKGVKEDEVMADIVDADDPGPWRRRRPTHLGTDGSPGVAFHRDHEPTARQTE